MPGGGNGGSTHPSGSCRRDQLVTVELMRRPSLETGCIGNACHIRAGLKEVAIGISSPWGGEPGAVEAACVSAPWSALTRRLAAASCGPPGAGIGREHASGVRYE